MTFKTEIEGGGMSEKCGCYQCAVDRMDFDRLSMMILCPNCGNKRCPHATNHKHICTGSNDSGQRGSMYGDYEATKPEGFDEAMKGHTAAWMRAWSGMIP